MATISHTNEAGKNHVPRPIPAVLICRVRGLHLPENMLPGGGFISAFVSSPGTFPQLQPP